MSYDTMSDRSTLVAIINYNTREELRGCLDSLRPRLDCVVVFDNNSTDGSAEFVRTEYPEAQLIESRENLGYGAAANRVFLSRSLAGNAEFFILSNSDVVFAPGAVESLVEDLIRHPEAAVSGPRLLNSDGSLQRSCFPLPGGWRWVFDNDASCAVLRLIPPLQPYLLRLWPHDRDREVPWVKGAVLAIRRSAFEQAGAFDESFFMYYEETDLCFRLAKNGWRIRFTPATEVVHLGGASTAKIRTEMAVELFVSSLRFAQRHYSHMHSEVLLYFWKVIVLVRLLRDWSKLTFTSEPQCREPILEDLRAWWRALSWGFRDLERRENGRSIFS